MNLLSEEEEYELLVTFNDTAVAYPKDKTIVDLFEEQADKTPEQVAIVFEDIELTYRELDERSNQLAHYLKENYEIQPDDFVGIKQERSEWMIISILGVLKSGGAYVPIDPAYPQERIAYIEKDTQCKVVLDETELSKFKVSEGNYSKGSVSATLGENHLAYVIYTSGSTGDPKGVMINHGNLYGSICNRNAYYDHAASYLMIPSFSFDSSVAVLWGSLTGGSTLFLASDSDLKDMTSITGFVQAHDIASILCVPSYYQLLLSHSTPDKLPFDRVILAGDSLTNNLIEKHFQLLPDCLLYNEYGPTENTVWSTVANIKKEIQEVHIGKPIGNTQIYIVDTGNNLVPQGVTGEILLGGDQVARGYLNQDVLTQEKFIRSPFKEGERLYKTGDLGRWLPDGSIEFIGRKDDQVKVRGYRIELGEIAHALMSHGAINEAIALSREDTSGEKELVAYITSDTKQKADELRNYLGKILPSHMLPAYFVQLDAMPLTTNGKVDKKSLPDPEGLGLSSSVEYVAAETDKEKTLVAVWSDVLKRDRIGIKDNFYSLGGDSIKFIQVIARLKQHGYALKVEHLLKAQVLEELAQLMEHTTGLTDQVGVRGEVVLTPIQEWFFNAEAIKAPDHFNQSVLLYSKEALDGKILEQSLEDLTRHHDALRMVYQKREGSWEQVNQDTSSKRYTIDFHDLRETANGPEHIAKIGEELQSSIKLSDGPLLRAVHFRLADGDRLGLIIHHLVVDGVSWRILLEDLSTLYTGYKAGKSPSLPLKTDSFQRWALLQQEYATSNELSKERAYWQGVCDQQIAGLPFDKGVKEGQKIEIDASESFSLSTKTTGLLQTRVHGVYNTEINDVLLTGLGLALQEVLGVDQSVLKMEGHGREEIIDGVDISRTIGWFTTTYPFVLNVSDASSQTESLVSVKESLRKLPNKGIGFGMLAYLSEEGFESKLNSEIAFNYLGDFGSNVSNDEGSLFEYASEHLGPDASKENELDAILDVSGMLVKGSLNMSIRYSGSRYDESTIKKLTSSYQKHLESLIETLSNSEDRYLTPSDLSFKGLSRGELSELNSDNTLEDVYELSPLQEGIYYYWLTEKSGSLYLGQTSYRVRAKTLDIEKLKGAYDQLIARHAVLRTSFSSDYAGRSLQIVRKEVLSNFTYEQLNNGSDIQAQLTLMKQQGRESGFDLNSGSQVRLHVVILSEGEYEFIWSFHHVLMDGWCASVLINDFNELFRAETQGREANLPPVVPYSNYIKWLKARDKKDSRDYWDRYLAGYSGVADLPFKINTSDTEYNEANEYIQVEGVLYSKVDTICSQLGITFNTFFQGVWGYLLAQYNNTSDVVFGAVVSGRPPELQGVEDMVGMFINTIPIRVRYQSNDTPATLLQSLQEQAIQSASHHYLNLSETVSQNELGVNLISHLLVYDNYPKDLADDGDSSKETEADLTIASAEIYEENNYQLNVVMVPGDESLTIDIRYNANLFDQDSLKAVKIHFENLIDQFLNNTTAPLNTLNYLSEEEKYEQLTAFNATDTSYPESTSVIALFEKQVEETPYSIAIKGLEKSYTYKELDEIANQLAHSLIQNYDIKPNDLIGIKLLKDEWSVISMLGVLKTGAAYIPIDPEYPSSRRQHIIHESQIALLITTTNYLFDEAEFDGAIFAIDVEFEKDEYSKSRINEIQSNTDLAYVIYTSGSTGNPKGVMIEHVSLTNYLNWARSRYSQDSLPLNFGLFTSLSFDLTVTSIYLPLISGGAITVFDSTSDVSTITKVYFEGEINCIKLTPAHISLLGQLGLEITKVQVAIIGGDKLEHAHVQILRGLNPKIRIYNEYGPTESTVGCTIKEVGFEKEPILIGNPIANTQIYVLNESGQLSPKGLIGEISISGEGLARGYLNQPELTAEKFIENPFIKGERLYKTGDLGRWLSDGNIEFIGRKDDQLKIKGYRIESGEIESVLGSHDGVEVSAVLAKENEDNEQSLVAYVVPNKNKAYTVNQILKVNEKDLEFDANLYEMDNGVSMYSYNRSEVKMLYTEVFEIKTYYKHGIVIPKDACILDVGANVGAFSIFSLLTFENPTIYAFEPLSPIYGLLEKNMDLYQGNVEIFNVGISDKEEEAVFDYYPYATVLSGRHSENYEVKDSVKKFIDNTHKTDEKAVTNEQMEELLEDRLSKKEYTCQLKTLSQVIRENGITHIDLLKVDAENAELDIINGITEEDWDIIDQIIIEVYDDNDRLKQIKQTLESYGFTVSAYQSEELKDTKFYDVYCVKEKQIIEGKIEESFKGHWYSTNALTESVRQGLRDKLPGYMVPSEIVLLDNMPLTSNSKLDRKALLEIDISSLSNKIDFIAPGTEEEKVLVSVWSDVLKRESIGIRDSFYNLGGDSIKSIQVVARLKQHGYTLKVEHLLRTPVLEDLARLIEQTTQVADQGEVSGEVVLTPIQKWFFEADEIKVHDHFNQSVLLHSKEPLDGTILERCLEDLTHHHDALRMVYQQREGVWQQTNHDTSSKHYTLDFYDLREADDALGQMAELGEAIQSDISIAKGPLFRVVHFRLKNGDRLGLIIHHLVVDGVSWRTLLEDLSLLYKGYKDGQQPELPSKTDSFQRWALLQKEYAASEKLEKERAYWQEVCDLEITGLPQDKTLKIDQTAVLNTVESFDLNKKTTELLQTKVHRVYNTEINDVLLTSLGLAIREVLSVSQSVLKMEGHGREEIVDGVDISRTVGWFTTTYPFVLKVSDDSSQTESLVSVKESLRSIPNKGIGYGTLAYLSEESFESKLTPEITFNYLGDFGSNVSNEDGALFEYASEHIGANVSTANTIDAILDVSGMLVGGSLSMSIRYASSRYEEATIKKLVTSYQKHLEFLIETLAKSEETYLTPSDLSFKGLSREELSQLDSDRNLEDVYELSPLQEGIYYHWLTEDSNSLYFEQTSYRVQAKKLDIEKLKGAYDQLVARHAILRTSFSNDYAGRSLQIVRKGVPSNFTYVQLDGQLDPQSQVERIKEQDRERGFDLASPSQMCLKVIDLSEGAYEFIWSHHHILMDGWCVSVLIHDFNELLSAEIQGRAIALAPVVPYVNYINWLKTINRNLSLNYWKEYLAGYSELAGIPFKAATEDTTYVASGEHLEVKDDLFKKVDALCTQLGITHNTFIQGVWGYLLSRYNNTNDVVFGAVVSGRPADLHGVEDMIGLFINTVPVRVTYDAHDTPVSLLESLHEQSIQSTPHHYTNLSEVQAQSELGMELMDHIMIFENYAIKELESEGALNSEGEEGLSVASMDVFERTNYDFNVMVSPSDVSLRVDIAYNLNSYDPLAMKDLVRHFDQLINEFAQSPDQSLGAMDYLSKEEQHQLLITNNDTIMAYSKDKTIVDLFEEQVALSPGQVALVFEDTELTYQELNEQSNQLAHYLQTNYDIQPDDLVGIKQDRSEWMLISILGVLKSGGAYVPMTPDYPQERVTTIIEDSKCKVLVDADELLRFREKQDEYSSEQLSTSTRADHLAYVIYTSGSTGTPKGVMIEHRNVTNFFTGMTSIFGEDNGTFLSMTNFTFDISVLELLWTLSKGYKVVIQGDTRQITDEDNNRKPLDFSLFYFGNYEDGEDKYKLLMEGAKYADENDYLAVWTPERHFNEFGGLYPNSSLMAAALSSITKNVGIRAGSIVLPLHHPIRIAEDWSVIDNLSHGRAGIACASGWNANDFVLAPDNYGKRHEVMYKSIETLRKLWKGESVAFENGLGDLKETKIFPSPVQDEIPLWVTSTGNIETFISAGKIGANILTHLLGISIEDLAERIIAYRKAYVESGHDISQSKVTLMVHTYIDEEVNIEKKARQPFIDYIKTSAGLIQQLVPDIDQQNGIDGFSEDELEAIYERAYERFVATSSLVGTKEACFKRLQKLSAIGVDEIAALIDFGVDYDSAMQSLERLTEIKATYNAPQKGYSIDSQIKKHKVTHLQTTPSMGVMLKQHLEEVEEWSSLQNILLGGEPATASLVNDLYEKLPNAQLYNMYGPTETTIWATVKAFEKNTNRVEIGKPIANTKVYILDDDLNPVATGVQGELYIGGEGVARGYTSKQLTDLSFIESPFVPGDRLYRTGDYGSWLSNGSIYCSGRKDQQVKIRGYRIELGEIEQALLRNEQINEAVVLAKEGEEKQLVAYLTSNEEQHAGQLRSFLLEFLPHYMIPNHFVQLEELPLNTSGKIDKKLLPDPEGLGLSGGTEYLAPRNELEEELVKLWAEVLQNERIGVNDDFFALGGHSLSAMQLIIRVKEIFGVNVDLRNLLSKPTIDSLSQEISTLKWMKDKSEELIVEGDELII